jgi:hypothetical protein
MDVSILGQGEPETYLKPLCTRGEVIVTNERSICTSPNHGPSQCDLRQLACATKALPSLPAKR